MRGGGHLLKMKKLNLGIGRGEFIEREETEFRTWEGGGKLLKVKETNF